MNILDFLIIFFLIVIAIQDYKYRGVSWILFPIGFLLLAIKSINFGGLTAQTSLFLINIGILLFVFFLLVLYFSFKNKKIVNIVNSYIGIGDLLFLIIIALCFSAINFILFINVSLLLILISYLFLSKLLKFDTAKVPFAGLLSLFYLVFYLLNILWLKLNPYIDLNIIYDF